MPELSNEKIFPAKKRVTAKFDPSLKWRLVEDFGMDSFTEQPDGSLLFECDYSDDGGLLAWMLSCRDMVTVIEPQEIREKLLHIASDITQKYEVNNHGKQSTGGNRSAKRHNQELPKDN